MGDAAAGNPEERCRSCFEPRRSRNPVGGLFARKPTAKQWQGILETAHRTPRRYGKTRRACITSSFRAICVGERATRPPKADAPRDGVTGQCLRHPSTRHIMGLGRRAQREPAARGDKWTSHCL